MDYVVSVSDVHGIYHGLPLIPTPDLPPAMDGEVQLGDRRIPVLNLRRFAGMSDEGCGSVAPWIVMVNDDRGPIGLAVDRVTEVVQLSEQGLQRAEDLSSEPVGEYIVAVARHHGRSMYLPDWNRLLHDAIQ
jgi:purine-binding chemotaxis protein CheW